MRLTITRKGVQYVLKVCPGCEDEWYAKRKQNRCTLCGTGLVMRTKVNIDWFPHELRGRVKLSEALARDERTIQAIIEAYS